MATDKAHGTRAMYTHGKCRCPKCKSANTTYFKVRRAAIKEAGK